jgi:hypothetical protein
VIERELDGFDASDPHLFLPSSRRACALTMANTSIGVEERCLVGNGIRGARAAAFRGDFDEARDFLRQAADHFAELGAIRGWHGTFCIGADVERLAGDEDAAWRVLRSATESEGLDPEAQDWAGLDVALHHALVGEADEAERWLDRSVGAGTVDRGWYARAIRLRIMLVRGHMDDALGLARDLYADQGERHWLDSQAECLEAAANVFAAAGENEGLRTALDDLADAYRRRGNLVALGRTEDRIAALEAPG